jgi:hypothetical protein
MCEGVVAVAVCICWVPEYLPGYLGTLRVGSGWWRGLGLEASVYLPARRLVLSRRGCGIVGATQGRNAAPGFVIPPVPSRRAGWVSGYGDDGHFITSMPFRLNRCGATSKKRRWFIAGECVPTWYQRRGDSSKVRRVFLSLRRRAIEVLRGRPQSAEDGCERRQGQWSTCCPPMPPWGDSMRSM